MFKMTETEVRKELEKINRYIRNCLWMDFELAQLNFTKIVLAGQIDQSTNTYAIDIEFEEPHCISSLFLWSTDTSVPLIELATKEEAMAINTKYQVVQGNYIFKINVEDFQQTPTFIAAKKIHCKIIDEQPFG